MTELLTESFCERCGTRYTFESLAGNQGRLGSLKVLGLGLKNFVMSDGSTIDEAMASARSEASRDLTNHQLDAFHKTFSFCMSCRQYTCGNCWNAAEAHCLTCSPLSEPVSVPVPDDIDPARLLRYTAGDADSVAADAADLATSATEEAPPHEPVPPLAEASELEETPPLDAPAPAVAAGDQVQIVPAGPSLDDEIAAFEAAPRAEATEPALVPEPEESAFAETDAEDALDLAWTLTPEVAPEAQDENATAPDETNGVEAGAEAVSEEAPKRGDDTVVQPAWPTVSPAPTTPPTAPQWPTGPRWPTGMPSGGVPAPDQPAQPDPLAALMSRGPGAALWAASNLEVTRPTPTAPAMPVGLQSCGNCGISLSASARFCRRCGTPQG